MHSEEIQSQKYSKTPIGFVTGDVERSINGTTSEKLPLTRCHPTKSLQFLQIAITLPAFSELPYSFDGRLVGDAIQTAIHRVSSYQSIAIIAHHCGQNGSVLKNHFNGLNFLKIGPSKRCKILQICEGESVFRRAN